MSVSPSIRPMSLFIETKHSAERERVTAQTPMIDAFAGIGCGRCVVEGRQEYGSPCEKITGVRESHVKK